VEIKGHNKFGSIIRACEGRVLGLHGGGTDNVLPVRSRITTVRVSSAQTLRKSSENM
jgi:hypothetical protein